MRANAKRFSALLIALVLIVALLPAEILAVSVEESEYVSSVQFGVPYLTMRYDAEGDRYLVPFPDTVATTAAKGLVTYAKGPDTTKKYKIKNLRTGAYLAATGNLNGNQYIGTKTTLIAGNVKPEDPLDLQLEAGTMSGASFTGETETINFHFYRDLKLQSLTLMNGESALTLTPAFDSLTYSYTAPLQEGQETVTIVAAAQTAAATVEAAGTLLLYTDQNGNAVEPLEGTENTFSVPSLPKAESGVSYLNVTVDYSDASAEVGKSTYTLLFLDPAVCMPTFTMEEGPELSRAKGSTEPIRILAEGDYGYQWYETDRLDRLVLFEGTPIEGATEPSYIPETGIAGTQYLWCDVTNTVEGVPFTVHSPGLTLEVERTWLNPPVITLQPWSIETKQYADIKALDSEIRIKLQELDTVPSFRWYRGLEADGSDAVLIDPDSYYNYTDYKTQERVSKAPLDTGTPGVFYYFCVVQVYDYNDPEKVSEEVRSDIISLSVAGNPYTEALSGAGTEEDPWLIQSLEDLYRLKSTVEKEYGTKDKYFLLTTDLELPLAWEPIGNLKDDLEDTPENQNRGGNVNPFMGHFDGGNHLVSIADGGQTIFKYVRQATIANLQIYGADIVGSALVTGSFCDYGPTGIYDESNRVWCVDIDNVILKEGSRTSKSGIVNGSGSGMNTITISNSIVEKNVTIGTPGVEAFYGSFVGDFNGVLRNCVSCATVYGTGGLAGLKGQTMGACGFFNCSFFGTVISETYAGGIIGTGYGFHEYEQGTNSAPNTPPVTIQNCLVAGSITGKTMVGGIMGGEPDLMKAVNQACISDNCFFGTLTATDSESYVGGIIGYLGGYDTCQDYHGNYWLNSCGAERGIGHINYVVTTEDPEYGDKYPILEEVNDAYIDRICTATTAAAFADGTVTAALNASETSYKNWVQGEDGYPVHGDAAYATALELDGDFKTDYVIGDELDMTGASFTVKYSDGTETPVALEEITFSGFDSATRGFKTVTAAFGPVSVEFEVCVLYPDNGQTIRVLLSIWGDTRHDSTATGQTVHTMADRNLELWAAPAVYEVGPNATVRELLEQVMTAKGMSWENPSGNYIETVTYGNITIGEFTNGPDSGWMYFYNGVATTNGIAQQFLEEGDEVVFRYTDDYTKEVGGGTIGGSDNVSFRSVTAVGSTAAPSIAFNADGYSVTTVSIGSTAITLTDTAEDDAFVITSTGDVPAAVLVKDAEGNYSRRAVTTEEGVHKVNIAAGESVVVGVLGDANGDGTLSARDATLILRTLTYNGTAENSTMDDLARLIADADGNSKLTVRDVTLMLRFLTYHGTQPNSTMSW